MRTIDPVALQRQLDKAEIADVVQTERAARDQAQWPRMLDCFHPDSHVEISWFQGTGREFVAASERLYDAGTRSLHQMGPTLSRICGNRALAETGCAILLHGTVAGVDVRVTSYSRLHQRLERRDGAWRLSSLRIVYQHDGMAPIDPSQRLTIDRVLLASLRPSYRFLSYLLAESGESVAPNLAGTDQPATIATLLEIENDWLLAADGDQPADAPSPALVVRGFRS